LRLSLRVGDRANVAEQVLAVSLNEESPVVGEGNHVGLTRDRHVDGLGIPAEGHAGRAIPLDEAQESSGPLVVDAAAPVPR